MLIAQLLIGVAVVVVVCWAAVFCPHECICTTLRQHICHGLPLPSSTNVSRRWSRSTHSLSIINSPIQSLRSDAFRQFVRLHTLTIEHTAIISINRYAFRGLRQLRLINITNNRQLRIIGNHAFASIGNEYGVQIQLTHNSIEHIHRWAFANNSDIRCIDLRYNSNQIRIDSHAFADIDRFDFLRLDCIVHIDAYTFSNTTQLNELTIDNSTLTINAYTFAGLSYMRQLIIIRSHIIHIHQFAFRQLQTIGLIHIVDCSIDHIHDDAFAYMDNVGQLILTTNSIVRIDHGAFRSQSANIFSIEHNHINCTCNNRWLIADRQVSHRSRTLNYCQWPIELNRRTLADIDLVECYPTPAAIIVVNQSSPRFVPLLLLIIMIICQQRVYH